MLTTLSLFDEQPTPVRYAGKFQPRDYQIEDIERSFELWDSGTVGVLTRLWTGAGKTFCCGWKAKRWLDRSDQHRVMVLSYEQTLVWQISAELESLLGTTNGMSYGIEMGTAEIEPGTIPKIVIASRQSLMRHELATQEQRDALVALGIGGDIGCLTKAHAKRIIAGLQSGASTDEAVQVINSLNSDYRANHELRQYSRLYKFDHRYHWLLIADEAHKYAMHHATTGHLIDWFERNPEHRRNGITATPKRSDAVSIGSKLFPGISIDLPYRKAIELGYAVPFRQEYIVVEGIDFTKLASFKADQEKRDRELSRMLSQEEILAELCLPLLDKACSRRTLIFSPSVEVAKDVAAFINARTPCECPACHVRKWYATLLLGTEQCACGQVITAGDSCQTTETAANAVYGEMPTKLRQAVYDAHQAGAFQFLSVCSLCIAEGTSVLTDRGEVPIELVTTDMRVWDGVEFVSHAGVIFKGIKPVIDYEGLTATEDHNVWTRDGWQTLADCKQKRLALCISGISGSPVREDEGYYRQNGIAWKTTSATSRSGMYDMRSSPSTKKTAKVYDILNAGPRHRFTANGIIVSNCKEGYNDPAIACVAVFRPVSKEASSLAEQMKGRGGRPLKGIVDGLKTAEERRAAIAASSKPDCLIIDLCGVTRLADCASTAQIYADGLDDEVAERADILMFGGMPDPEEAIAQAQRDIAAEREAAAKAKAADDEARRIAAESRSAAGAVVTYSSHTQGFTSTHSPGMASEKQIKLLHYLGMDFLNWEPSLKQAGRIITQLKSGIPFEQVAYQNGIKDENWSKALPSVAQQRFLAKRGINAASMTPKQASDAIESIKTPQARADNASLVANAKEMIDRCRRPDDLDHVAYELAGKKHQFTQSDWNLIIAHGKKTRTELEAF